MTYGNRHLSLPFRIGPKGRPVQVTSIEEHIREEITQLILTTPGERLFIPEFGAGLNQLIFMKFDESTVALAVTALKKHLVKWLGHRIILDNLKLEVKDESLILSINYRIKETNESQVLHFQKREY